MEKQQQSLSKQEKKTQQIHSEKQAEQSSCCANCGTPCQHGDKFCEECGMPLKNSSCPHCAAVLQPNWEICPHCGHSLSAETCSFCGAPMDAHDSFCPDCGNPRTGITCPHCQTLNFRSFCRKCNTPLDEMAMQEMQKAKSDPVFCQMVTLAQQLADLEDRLLADPPANAPQDEPEWPRPELSEADRKLIEQYKELLSGTAPLPPPSTARRPEPKTEPPTNTSRPKIQLNVKKVDLDEVQQSYKEKLDEMKQLIAKLRPEGDTTPQMQRNYYSARKVMVVRKKVTKAAVCWVCNLCGFKHNQPSECAQPELGGTWMYEDIMTTTRSYEYVDD